MLRDIIWMSRIGGRTDKKSSSDVYYSKVESDGRQWENTDLNLWPQLGFFWRTKIPFSLKAQWDIFLGNAPICILNFPALLFEPESKA